MIELTQKERDSILKKFMIEYFPFSEFKKIGLFTKEMKGDYKSQAARICHYFGFKEVHEYGKIEIRCHISYAGGRPLSVNENGKLESEPFVTIIPSIWDDI